MSLGPLGKRARALGQLGELPVHQRAKIRQRTSCINERQNNHVTPQIRELDGFPSWPVIVKSGTGSPISSRSGLSRSLTFPFETSRTIGAAAPAW